MNKCVWVQHKKVGVFFLAPIGRNHCSLGCQPQVINHTHFLNPHTRGDIFSSNIYVAPIGAKEYLNNKFLISERVNSIHLLQCNPGSKKGIQYIK